MEFYLRCTGIADSCCWHIDMRRRISSAELGTSCFRSTAHSPATSKLCLVTLANIIAKMDDSPSSGNAPSSATIASAASSSATVTSSRTSASSNAYRPRSTKQHSFTHVFPAKSEHSSERMLAPKKDSAASRAAMRELLSPTTSMNPDERTKMLFNGLQWLLESSNPSHELDKCSSQPLKALSHDAISAFNSEGRRHKASNGTTSKANGSGSQSTETWIEAQSQVTREKPW